MANDLKIQIVVDGSQVAAGMTGVSTTVEAATARIKAAFGSVADAPVGIQNALLVLQNSARMSGEAVTEATAAIAALGEESQAAASGMGKMESSMAFASARALGFASGMGFTGSALARVAAMSSSLAPILAAAFPVVGAIALVDVLGTILDKLDALAEQPLKVRLAFAQLGEGLDKALNEAQGQLNRLNERFLTITQGPIVGMQAQLAHVKENFGNIEAASSGAFVAIEKGLKEADIWRLNPVNLFAWLRGVDIGVKDLKPLADKINLSLVEALRSGDKKQIQQALTEGITELTRVERETATGAYAAQPDPFGGAAINERFNQRVLAIRSMIAALEQLRDLEKDEAKIAQGQTGVQGAEIDAKRAAERQKQAEAALKFAEAVRKLNDEQTKAAQSAKQLADAEAEFGRTQGAKELESDTNDLSARLEAERGFQQDRLSDERQAQIAAIDLKEQAVSEQFRIGQISAAQEVQQLNALEQQKLQIETAYLQQRINVILGRLQSDDAKMYSEDLKEWSKLLSQKQAAEEAYQKNRLKNLDGNTNNEIKTWQKLTQQVNQAFDGAFRGMLTGTERFSTAFARLFDSLLSSVTSFLANIALKWAEHHLALLLSHSTFLANILGLETANNTVKQAQNAAAASLQVTQQAGIAGAGAFASVMTALPFPANVGTAPGVMAAAIAETLSNISLASAAGGWDVPSSISSGGALSLIHPSEMVLPKELADTVRGRFGGGGATLNYNVGGVHAIDARGVEDVLSRHSKHIVKLMQRELRRSNQL